MTVYVLDENLRLIPKAEKLAREQVHVIGDVMEPVQSMASGKWYSSKSALRAEYRSRGYEEVGNEYVGGKNLDVKREVRTSDIRDLWARAERRHRYKNDY